MATLEKGENDNRLYKNSLSKGCRQPNVNPIKERINVMVFRVDFIYDLFLRSAFIVKCNAFSLVIKIY